MEEPEIKTQNWKNLKECDKVWDFPNNLGYDHLYGFWCSYIMKEDAKLAAQTFFEQLKIEG